MPCGLRPANSLATMFSVLCVYLEWSPTCIQWCYDAAHGLRTRTCTLTVLHGTIWGAKDERSDPVPFLCVSPWGRSRSRGELCVVARVAREQSASAGCCEGVNMDSYISVIYLYNVDKSSAVCKREPRGEGVL